MKNGSLQAASIRSISDYLIRGVVSPCECGDIWEPSRQNSCGSQGGAIEHLFAVSVLILSDEDEAVTVPTPRTSFQSSWYSSNGG